jgi:hypothetical protein
VSRWSLEDCTRLRVRDTYHEDYGDVLWWYVREGAVCEPPIVGTYPGNDTDRYDEPIVPEYVTHWSPIPEVHVR